MVVGLYELIQEDHYFLSLPPSQYFFQQFVDILPQTECYKINTVFLYMVNNSHIFNTVTSQPPQSIFQGFSAIWIFHYVIYSPINPFFCPLYISFSTFSPWRRCSERRFRIVEGRKRSERRGSTPERKKYSSYSDIFALKLKQKVKMNV